MSMFIGKQIEITSINPSMRTIGVIIHLFCAEKDAATAQMKIPLLVDSGCKYLIAEGFIENGPWLTHVAGIIHPQIA